MFSIRIGSIFPIHISVFLLQFGVGMVLRREILGSGQHGSTFGGNPVVCAGGVEVMKQICKAGFLDDVSARAEYFTQMLV